MGETMVENIEHMHYIYFKLLLTLAKMRIEHDN